MQDHFKVTKLLFVQTGTYNDIPLRPYIANADLNAIDIMRDVTGGGRNLSSTNICGVAGNILQPSSHAEGIVNIANGWGESRFRFLMEVEIESPFMQSATRYVLTGFTDYLGIAPSGAVDPHMRLYFNNSIMLGTVTEQTAYGNIERTRLIDASHVLHGRFTPVMNNGYSTNGSMYSMRPEDIFSSIGSQMAGGGTVSDLRTSFGLGPKMSRRSNGSASTYLSRALEAHRSALQSDDGNADYSRLLRDAQGSVREVQISENRPLHILRQRTGYNHEDFVTYGELESLSPGMDQHVTRHQLANSLPVPVHLTGATEHFQGSTMETIAATIIAQSVPALMMDCVLTGITFNVTNDTIGGQVDLIVGPVNAFSNINLEPYIEAFKNRFIHEVFPDITKRNMLVVSAEISVDILGETAVTISIDNRPFVPYVIPSFADALTAPVLTSDQNNLSMLANSISNLTEQISIDTTPEVNYHAGIGRSL